MPVRLLRPGINDSERVNLLDAHDEVFYRRLMSEVDDFGIFDGRPSKLRAALFPLRIDRIREADISRWSAACAKAGLIVLYEVRGQPYMVLLGLGEARAKKSKYPPPSGVDFERAIAEAHEEVPGTLVLSGRNGPGKTWLAAALVNAFCDAGRPALYCTAQGYYRELQKRFGKSELMDAWHARLSCRDRVRGFQLLVIDEVEVQPQHEWHLNELRDLINERYGRFVATLLITNLSIDQINRGGTDQSDPAGRCFNTAIRDRIKQIGTILECRWPSLREPEWGR